MLIENAGKLDQLSQRSSAMETILTNPDHLANYTDKFFTDIVPVDIDGTAGVAHEAAQAPLPQQPAQEYQPTYDMPAVPAAGGGQIANNPAHTWEHFGNVMDRSPQNAWKYLSQMSPEAMRSKLLFMDGA